MKKTLRGIIAVVLCMMMLYTAAFHNVAFALDLSSGEMREVYPENEPVQIEFPDRELTFETDSNAKKEEADILYEDVAKRDERVKEFVMSDKTRMLVLYPEKVHYSKNGNWADIDNTLVQDTTAKSGGYKNKAGSWEVKFPAMFTAGDSEISVKKGDKVIKFSAKVSIEQKGNLAEKEVLTTSEPLLEKATGNNAVTSQIADMESKTVSAVKMTSDEFVKEVDASAKVMMPEEINSGLRYKGAYSDVDIEYRLVGETLKENIIFNKKPTKGTIIRFPVSVENLSLVLNEDKTIWAVSKESNSPEFVMPAPYMIDANGEICQDIEVSLEIKKDGYEIVYRPSEEWLNDAKRAYPVTVDPVVTPEISSSAIEDKQVCSDPEHDNKLYTSSTNQIGYSTSRQESRVYLKYSQLPEILATDVLVDAKIYMHLQSTNTTDPLQINVHKVNAEWYSEDSEDSEDTEDRKGLTWGTQPAWNATVEDYALVTTDTTYDGENYYFWDVTEIVRGWYETGINTGMMFKCTDEIVQSQTVNYKIFESSDSAGGFKPLLTITYLSGSGLESYWDYHTYDCGRAGTAYVNDYTGNLVLVNNAISTSGTRTALNVNTVYNGNTSNSNKFSIAYGWRTNYNQLVYQMPDNSQYYIWEDEDGTLHYFYYASSGTYKDESGLELTLTTTGSGDKKYCISDKNGNCSYFDTSGRLKSIENNQLTKSTITVTYADGNRIQSIKDAVNRTCTFSYSSVQTDGVTEYFLSEIKLTSANNVEVYKLRYEINLGNIDRITYPDDKYARYSYAGTTHLLMRTRDVGTYGLYFIYTTLADEVQNKVKRVARYNGNSACGTVNMTYEKNRTIFVDSQSNKEIKFFNKYGNTVTVQDDEGRAQYSIYATESGDATPKNNQLVAASKLQNTVKNYIKNSSFEESGNWRFFITGTGNYTFGYSSDEKYLGLNSLKLGRTDNNGTILAQAPEECFIDVEAGKTYTLSAYVKTTGMSGSGNGARMQLEIDGGNVVAVSKVINTNQDWQRIEISYTHPMGGGAASLKWQVQNSSSGNAYFDCVQIEQMPTASRYNLIENGDFSYLTNQMPYHWTKDATGGTAGGRITITGGKAADHLDAFVYRITGTATNINRCYQDVQVSGQAGDVYTLAGWGKAQTVPLTMSERRFALMALINNTDDTTTEYMASFDPTTSIDDNWNYVAKRIVAEKDYDSIRVFLVFDKCLDYAYFDGIQLFKEEFGNSYTYDDDGNVTSVSDLRSQQTGYSYSDDNNLISAALPANAKFEYTYDDYHNVETAKSGYTEEGTSDFVTLIDSEMIYDNADPDNSYGNNTSVVLKDTAPNSNLKIKTSVEYDSTKNHITSSTDELGRVTTYTIDANTGLLKYVRLPGETSSKRTEYTYDNMQRVTQVMKRTLSSLGGLDRVTVNYTYNGDLLTKLIHSNTSEKSTQYNFTYGALDLISKISIGTDEDATRTLVTYDYYDTQDSKYSYNLRYQNYANGSYIYYTYDKKNRLTSTVDSDSFAVVQYSYDNNGNLGAVNDGFTGRKTKYLYDFADRLMRTEEEGQDYYRVFDWEYDLSNNLKKTTDKIQREEETLQYVTEYEYDKANRPTSITSGNVKASYVYDGLNRVERWSYSKSNTERVAYVPTYTTYTVDNEQYTSTQISSLAITSGSAYNKNISYVYDTGGNISSVGFDDNETTYVYDDLSQLVRENNEAAGKTWVYTYDAGGNITQKAEYAYTTGTLGTALDVITYGYDDSQWGDLLTSYDGLAVTSDEIGNTLSDGTWSYTWTRGRMLASATSGSTTVNYTYNADGQRTSKTVGSKTWQYTYDGTKLVHMTDGANEVHFNYDASGVMGYTYNGSVYFYIKNAQGDVIAVANASGVVLTQYTYDAWGNTLTVTGNTTVAGINPFRYRSYVYDAETGLYYLNSRYYSPKLGRFISADSLINQGSILGNNMFAYCENNPVNMSDADGNLPKWITGALNVISGAVQMAAGAALGAFAGWTGVGAVAAGLLMVNGAATAAKGVSQIVNHVAKSNVLREENMARVGVQEVGRAIGGDTGAKVAGVVYDVATTAAGIYAGKVGLERSMPKIVESKVFSANNGYGLKIGKNIEMLYRNPNAAGGPGGTIFSYKGPLGKFRIDWDPAHGFHSHPPGH